MGHINKRPYIIANEVRFHCGSIFLTVLAMLQWHCFSCAKKIRKEMQLTEHAFADMVSKILSNDDTPVSRQHCEIEVCL